MPRLGSVLLAAVLLGVPRALEARPFGAPRSVYVDVALPAPGLAGFAEELQRALEAAGCRIAARPDGATTVVEVHALWTQAGAQAISFTVRDRRGRRPLVLHYPADRRADAARALLAALDAPGS